MPYASKEKRSQHYHQNKEKFRKYRAKRLANMTPAKREAERQKIAAYGRNWRKKHKGYSTAKHHRLMNDPTRRKKYLAQRHAQAKKYQQSVKADPVKYARYLKWLRGYQKKHRKHLAREMALWREKNLERSRASYRTAAANQWKKRKEEILNRNSIRRAKILNVSIDPDQSLVKALYRKVATAKQVICHYCRKAIPKKSRTIDHVIPLARGGKHSISNLVPACKRCNCRKHKRTADEFSAYLRELAA